MKPRDHPGRRRPVSSFCQTLLMLAFLHSAAMAPGAASSEGKLSDPENAWAEVERISSLSRPLPAWEGRAPTRAELAGLSKQAQEANRVLEVKAREFLVRFPTNENAGEARFLVALALNQAVAAGHTASEAELREFLAATLADSKLSEEDRVDVFLVAGNLPLMRKLGMRLFVEGQSKFHEEFDSAWKDTLVEARAKFPKSGRVYEFTLGLANRTKDREEQKRLASEVINAEGATAAMNALARHVFAGTKPYQIGQPVDVRFTALDGREVNLAALKGKVVLVDFWATDCAPCVGEMPEVKAAYDKLHARGFEIIGISLDEKETALRKFVREKQLAWPQYFDGKGWQNRFAIQYGIFSIPTMWLVDKAGNLRVPDAYGQLESRVTALLEE